MSDLLVFYVIAAMMIATGVSVITLRHPVVASCMLIANLFLIACLFALNGAHFVAAIQVLVYAGAIMVLFLFVIMLLNLKREELAGPKIPLPEYGVLGLIVLGFLYVGYLVLEGGQYGSVVDVSLSEAESGSNTYEVGIKLFTKYLWPFELTSFLILLAIIASIVIAKKDKVSEPKKG